MPETINKNDPAFLYLNLRPNEEVNLIVRHHWAGFLGTLVIVFFMGIFPWLLIGTFYLVLGPKLMDFREILIVILSSYYVFLLTFLFGNWINYYYDIIFITNERIINVAQEGLLARRTSELSMRQVENVTAQQHGFLRSLFNFGTLIVETAGFGSGDIPDVPGNKGYFTIEDIPDPNRVARLILDLHQAADHDEI